MPSGQTSGLPLTQHATGSTVGSLFAAQARIYPARLAAEDANSQHSYGQLDDRARRLAALFTARGIGRGNRVAILSENRLEYLEVFLAAARLGAIVACQNWRLTGPELAHCLDLVEPKVTLVSPRHAKKLDALERRGPPPLVFGTNYEDLLDQTAPETSQVEVDPEDQFLILYTSGTTGLPKGAVINHRTEVARNMVVRAEFGVASEDTFAAWSPLYHMGAAECALGTLMAGGKVIVIDGFDSARLSQVVADESLGWLLLMPGMVGGFAAELKRRKITAKSVKVCGVMADLVPPAEIAEITELLDAPYANTFGATETGCPPCSSNLIPIGVEPRRLSKQQSTFCEIRLVDANDDEVPDGTPGELCMRGPTLFSGYWHAPEVNAEDFRGGWFHMGDVFVRNADGTLDSVDRVKYMIKSGGENIYPAEIERVILQNPRVADAAVVRQPDRKWGETPFLFVARRDDSLSEEDLYQQCRSDLAGYKQPKGIRFIPLDMFPRSASGKIQRHELEKLLPAPGTDAP